MKDNSKGPRNSKNTQEDRPISLGQLIQNKHHAFVVLKSEKLASALYVITGFIPPDDPARNRLRVCAIDLISRSSAAKDLCGPGVGIFTAKCVEIGTILETAKSGGLISEMNANFINSEYTLLATFVRNYEGAISFEEPLAVNETLQDNFSKSIRHKNKSPLEYKEDKGHKNISKGLGTMSDRETVILRLLNSKEKISVKDVAVSMPEVGEKTLQRELSSLVQKGVLIKEGSRRWTTYRKATPKSGGDLGLDIPSALPAGGLPKT